MPVGYEVARLLGCELDVLVVRKVGVPYQPELAMGAVGEKGVVVRNREVMSAARIAEAVFDTVVAAETAELKSRVALYRQVAEPIDPTGRTVIVTDDGLATGSTALAAIDVARGKGLSRSGWRSRLRQPTRLPESRPRPTRWSFCIGPTDSWQSGPGTGTSHRPRTTRCATCCGAPEAGD